MHPPLPFVSDVKLADNRGFVGGTDGSALSTLKVSIPRNVDPAAVSSVLEAVERALAVVAGTGQLAVLQRADRLAELATGMLEPSVALIQDRIQRMNTVNQVFGNTDWIASEEINALQAEPPANKSHPASDWKRRGRLFSVNYGGKEYFARYQFDALFQPLPIIKEILKAFGNVADSWVLAAWFHFPNGWIARPGDKNGLPMPPKDALDLRAHVLKAAAQRLASYVA